MVQNFLVGPKKCTERLPLCNPQVLVERGLGNVEPVGHLAAIVLPWPLEIPCSERRPEGFMLAVCESFFDTIAKLRCRSIGTLVLSFGLELE